MHPTEVERIKRTASRPLGRAGRRKKRERPSLSLLFPLITSTFCTHKPRLYLLVHLCRFFLLTPNNFLSSSRNFLLVLNERRSERKGMASKSLEYIMDFYKWLRVKNLLRFLLRIFFLRIR